MKAVGRLDLGKLTGHQIIIKEESKISQIELNDEKIESFVLDTKKFEEERLI
jgi:hypothetical protein